MRTLGEAWPVPLQNDLAKSLQSRGIAKADGGDLAGAIADYDAAIGLREAIRAALGEARPVPFQNDFAGSLQNRGNAKANGGDLAGAIADYDAAIRADGGPPSQSWYGSLEQQPLLVKNAANRPRQSPDRVGTGTFVDQARGSFRQAGVVGFITIRCEDPRSPCASRARKPRVGGATGGTRA